MRDLHRKNFLNCKILTLYPEDNAFSVKENHMPAYATAGGKYVNNFTIKNQEIIMTRNLTIADRLHEVLLNGRWIANTNYKEQISGISWQQATQKVGTLNTIAALTYHINYYLAGLLSAFETGKLEISDKYSFDLPPINSDAEWQQIVAGFLSNAEKFVHYIGRMNDDIFDQPFLDERYGTYLRNIEGVIEHSYYHLGQISLIRKLQNDQDPDKSLWK